MVCAKLYCIRYDLIWYVGTVSGYTSARLYKTFGGVKWKLCLSASALLLPGIVFGIVFSLNLVFWLYGSSAAIPFLTLLSLLCLWLGVSVPLNFLGKQTFVYSLTLTVIVVVCVYNAVFIRIVAGEIIYFLGTFSPKYFVNF